MPPDPSEPSDLQEDEPWLGSGFKGFRVYRVSGYRV